MKAYALYPASGVIGRDPNGSRVQECIDAVTDAVVMHLRAGDDVFQCMVECHGSEPNFVRFETEIALRERVRACVDPYETGSGFGCHHGHIIRSAATCRSVSFGYDGQAFLCLRHEDSAPTSPDTSLFEVEENSVFLIETDWFDGFGWESDPDQSITHPN